MKHGFYFAQTSWSQEFRKSLAKCFVTDSNGINWATGTRETLTFKIVSSYMPGSFFFLDLSHSPQGLISSIAYPYGLGFSQFGGLRAFALLKWRLASKRQEAGMPDQLRKMPETRRTSLPPYSIGQSSHRTPPDLGAGDLDSALC